MKFMVSYQSAGKSSNQTFDWLHDAIGFIFANVDNWHDGFSIFTYYPTGAVSTMQELVQYQSFDVR